MEPSEEHFLMISTRHQQSQQSSQSNIILKKHVWVARLNIDQTLAHVTNTLCHTYHEQSIWIPVVVTCQSTQTASQSWVVGAWPNNTLSQDSIDGCLLIGVISHLRQHVHHWVVWTSDTQQSEHQRDGPPNLWISVVDDPLEHVHTNLFAEGDQADWQQGSCLMVVGVLITVFLLNCLWHDVQHLLDLEHIWCTGICTPFDQDLDVLSDWVWDHFTCSEWSHSNILLAEIQ